jgi:hypothetical protein
MKKPTIKSVTEEFEAHKVKAKDYVKALRYPQRRHLLSVCAADKDGRLNGMTVVELITVVRLTENTQERVYITVDDKTISLWAEKIVPLFDHSW